MDEDEVRRGCLTIPRVFSFNQDGRLCMNPVEEASFLLTKEDSHVQLGKWLCKVTDGQNILFECPAKDVQDVKILRDTHTCEVFLNGGETVCTFYFEP